MFGLTRCTIKKNERGLLLRNGDFDRVLQPGKQWISARLDTIRVETFSLEQTVFSHGLKDYLMAKEPKVIEQEFVRVELTENQVGLRFENGVLLEILAPSTRALYWKGMIDVRIEVIDITQSAWVDKALAGRLLQIQLRERRIDGLSGVLQVQVPASQVGVLTIDGKMEQILSAGNYAFWKFNRDVHVDYVDCRLQNIEVTGQEILTKDKVSLRLNLLATWRYTDVALAFTQLVKPAEHLYRELQLGLRSAVGTRTLDELLENKTMIDVIVSDQVLAKCGAYGLALESVGVRDIILPGDMKAILAQVVEAEKSAQANVIRRREETAATRSLMNTAKVMEDNPVALRMKELETLERIAEKIDKISVVGGLDAVLNSLVKAK